jgi:hypothetical protein
MQITDDDTKTRARCSLDSTPKDLTTPAHESLSKPDLAGIGLAEFDLDFAMGAAHNLPKNRSEEQFPSRGKEYVLQAAGSGSGRLVKRISNPGFKNSSPITLFQTDMEGTVWLDKLLCCQKPIRSRPAL